MACYHSSFPHELSHCTRMKSGLAQSSCFHLICPCARCTTALQKRIYFLMTSEYPAAIQRFSLLAVCVEPILLLQLSSSRFGQGGRGWRGEEKRRDFSAVSVLCDNECFVRENPSTVTVGGGNVRESYGLLAFNPRGPGLQSNRSTENVMLLHFIYLYCCLTG